MLATVSHILPLSFIDGPGSRMVVFFQGCNMRCLYCHNPETQTHCSNCGACIDDCQYGALQQTADGRIEHAASRCQLCDACLHACPNRSSPRARLWAVDELLERIKREAGFLDGVTLSGGECTLQHAFICQLLRRLRETTSLTCFVDTNGLIAKEARADLCNVADGFIVDVKARTGSVHRALTGTDNREILRTVEHVAACGKLYEARTVVVPGATDCDDEIAAIARLVANASEHARLRLIPFCPKGVRGPLCSMHPVSRTRLEQLADVARQCLGDRVSISGSC